MPHNGEAEKTNRMPDSQLPLLLHHKSHFVSGALLDIEEFSTCARAFYMQHNIDPVRRIHNYMELCSADLLTISDHRREINQVCRTFIQNTLLLAIQNPTATVIEVTRDEGEKVFLSDIICEMKKRKNNLTLLSVQNGGRYGYAKAVNYVNSLITEVDKLSEYTDIPYIMDITPALSAFGAMESIPLYFESLLSDPTSNRILVGRRVANLELAAFDCLFPGVRKHYFNEFIKIDTFNSRDPRFRHHNEYIYQIVPFKALTKS